MQSVQTIIAATAVPKCNPGVTPPGLHYSLTVNNGGGAQTLQTVLANSSVTLPSWIANGTSGPAQYPTGMRLSTIGGNEVRIIYDGQSTPVVGASAVGDPIPESPGYYEIRNQDLLLTAGQIQLLASADATKLTCTFIA